MNSKIYETLAVAIVFGGAVAVSWVFCCAIIKAICWCFGLAFSMKIVTGIWLCIWFFKLVFTKQVVSECQTIKNIIG